MGIAPRLQTRIRQTGRASMTEASLSAMLSRIRDVATSTVGRGIKDISLTGESLGVVTVCRLAIS